MTKNILSCGNIAQMKALNDIVKNFTFNSLDEEEMAKDHMMILQQQALINSFKKTTTNDKQFDDISQTISLKPPTNSSISHFYVLIHVNDSHIGIHSPEHLVIFHYKLAHTLYLYHKKTLSTGQNIFQAVPYFLPSSTFNIKQDFLQVPATYVTINDEDRIYEAPPKYDLFIQLIGQTAHPFNVNNKALRDPSKKYPMYIPKHDLKPFGFFFPNLVETDCKTLNDLVDNNKKEAERLKNLEDVFINYNNNNCNDDKDDDDDKDYNDNSASAHLD